MARNTTVILGAHNIHEPETTQQVRGVLSYHQHPEYDPSTTSNDIMLLKARQSCSGQWIGGSSGAVGLAGSGQSTSLLLAPSANHQLLLPMSAGNRQEWERPGREPWAGLGATCPIHSSSPALTVLYVLPDLPYLCAQSVLQLFCSQLSP